MADEVKPEVATDPKAAGDGGGDAAGEAAGEGGDDKATSKVSIPRHEYDGLQEASRRAKALETELAEARTNGAKPPTASPEVDDQRKVVQQREKSLAKLRAAAEAGSEEAQIVLDAREDALDVERRMLYRMEMQEIPAGERAEVKKFMDEKGIGSPAIANELMLGKKAPGLSAKIAELEAQVAELKKAPGRQPPKDTRTPGGGGPRPNGAAGEPEGITTAEYNDRMAKDEKGTIAARRAKKFVLID